MAQSDSDRRRNPLGIAPFWERPSQHAPMLWDKWLKKFRLALFAKEGIHLQTLLGSKPNDWVPPGPTYEPQPTNPTQASERERESRNAILKGRWQDERKRLIQKGAMCDDVPWDTAERKCRSHIYLCLGTEGRNIFNRRFGATVDVESASVVDLFTALTTAFTRPRNISFDRFNLFRRQQGKGESMEQFYCALKELADHCNLAGLEEEIIRDIFIANMANVKLQEELLRETKTPEEVLTLAINWELGTSNQRKMLTNTTSLHDSSDLRIKSEPEVDFVSRSRKEPVSYTHLTLPTKRIV